MWSCPYSPGEICLLKLVPVYTKAVKDYALELGLICNISYEKMVEIIYWAHGVKISRETLYQL